MSYPESTMSLVDAFSEIDASHKDLSAIASQIYAKYSDGLPLIFRLMVGARLQTLSTILFQSIAIRQTIYSNGEESDVLIVRPDGTYLGTLDSDLPIKKLTSVETLKYIQNAAKEKDRDLYLVSCPFTSIKRKS